MLFQKLIIITALSFFLLLDATHGTPLLRTTNADSSSSNSAVEENKERRVLQEEFCASGFIMDIFCIDRGNLLDRPSIVSLSAQGPSEHTLHCLVDIGVCIRSGYEMLKEKSNGNGFDRLLKFDDSGNTMVLEEARKAGSSRLGCSTCGTDGAQRKGFFATAIGVLEDSNGSDPPRLVTRKLVDGEVDCDSLRVQDFSDDSTSANLLPFSQEEDDSESSSSESGSSSSEDDEEEMSSSLPGGLAICFSGQTTVVTRDKGTIRMDQLRVGDYVLSMKQYNDDNQKNELYYEKVYSFGHYNPSAKGNFLQLNRDLELSKNHMVYIRGKGFISAGSVQVGDVFITSSKEEEVVVRSIRKNVSRMGVYAPFTLSGTILVNDILASSYVALTPPLEKEGATTQYFLNSSITYQWLSHAYMAPHRIWCNWLGNDKKDNGGVSLYAGQSMKLIQWILGHQQEQHTTITMILVLLAGISFLLFLSFWTAVEGTIIFFSQQQSTIFTIIIGAIVVAAATWMKTSTTTIRKTKQY